MTEPDINKSRYSKLSCETTSLGIGIDIPDDFIYEAESIIETPYPPCKYCGDSHGMGIKEMSTGKITPLDMCDKCFLEPCIDNFKHTKDYLKWNG